MVDGGEDDDDDELSGCEYGFDNHDKPDVRSRFDNFLDIVAAAAAVVVLLSSSSPQLECTEVGVVNVGTVVVGIVSNKDCAAHGGG